MISTSALIRFLKILLISTGAVSLSVATKSCVPVLVRDLSTVWTGFTAWLKPLYLYVIVNVIILVIVLASRFEQQTLDEFRPVIAARIPQLPDLNRMVAVAQPELKPGFGESFKGEPEPEVLEVKPVVVNGSIVAMNEDEKYDDVVAVAEAEDFSKLAIVQPMEAESGGFVVWPAAEKSLVASPLADDKPTLKAVLDSGLRLARPSQYETLENTWRMIMEKNHSPPVRQLRRSDTFESAAADENENHAQQPRPPRNRETLKSRTFKDRTNYDSPKASAAPETTAGKFRKEPSLSQDELNRRVEAFINKFNEEMRLQRQQSLQQHMEMIKRGAH